MTGPAAKGRKLLSLAAAVLAATAALLAPTPAGASRYAPTALEPRLTAPAVDLDAAAAAADQCFTLFTAADRARFVAVLAGAHAAAIHFSLFPDFAPGPGGPGARKLASGSSTWGDEPNAWLRLGIAPESQWRADLYQAFGYDGLNVTDPFGLVLPRNALADPSTPLYKHEGGWYQVNSQGLVYSIDLDDHARHRWVKDAAVIAAVREQAGFAPGAGDNPSLRVIGEVVRDTAGPVADAIEGAVAIGTQLSPLGDVNDAWAAATGYDPLAQDHLSGLSRLRCGAGALIPFISGGQLRGAVGMLESAVDRLSASGRGVLGAVDEAADALKRGGEESVRLGQAGERAAGISGNKTRIPSASGTATFRIPDELTEVTLREVKNAARVSNTSQLRDFLSYCRDTDRAFILEVRDRTRLSGPLQQLVDEGLIELRRSLP